MFYSFLQRNEDLATTEKFNMRLDKVKVIHNTKALEAFTAHYNELKTKEALQPTMIHPERKDWQEWILQKFLTATSRIPGNEGINLLLGWHGSSESTLLKIAENNFLESKDMAALGITKTDPGYFGDAIYLKEIDHIKLC